MEPGWERRVYQLYMAGDFYSALSLARDAAHAAAGRGGTCNAQCDVAEMLGRIGGGLVSQAWAEWGRARAAAVTPGEEAHVLAVAVYLCRVQHDAAKVISWVERLQQHVRNFHGRPEVTRWWPLVRTCVAELAAVYGDTHRAIEQLEHALDESPAMEPDPQVAADFRCVVTANQAWHYLSVGETDLARNALGACAAGPYLARVEALRCCAEAEYSLRAGDVPAAQSWIQQAKAAQIGRPEAVVRQSMVEAKLAQATGRRETAFLMATEARRLCAAYKQDQLAGPVNALYRRFAGLSPAPLHVGDVRTDPPISSP